MRQNSTDITIADCKFSVTKEQVDGSNSSAITNAIDKISEYGHNVKKPNETSQKKYNWNGV